VKIGYIGNFSRPWTTETHLAGSLESLGHQVVRWQENQVQWPRLATQAKTARVQMVLWTRTWSTPNDVAQPALEQLKAVGVPTVSYHLDRFWGLDREYLIHSEGFFRTDLLFTPDDGPWESAGVEHVWTPPGVYHLECEPVAADRQRWPHDVVFVGSHPYPHPEWAPYRTGVVNHLQSHYGDRFALWPQPRKPIRGADLMQLYASAKVVVGDSCLIGDPKRYWSDRVPETLGRGGVLVHPRVAGIEEWYEDRVDLMLYDVGDCGQMLEQVDLLLDNDDLRYDISVHGRQTVLERDTYRHRMQMVLDTVEERLGFPTAPAVAPVPARVGANHRMTRQRASFELAEGNTDRIAVREVWEDDTYQVRPDQVARGTVVDIGANVGAFSVLAARLGASQVYAYEPHPDSYAALVRNLQSNHVSKVTPHQRAVLGWAGTAVLVGDGGGAHIASSGPGRGVECVTFDSVIKTHAPIAYLKMDIEGSEFQLFETVDGELLNEIKMMAVEFHGPHMPHLSHLQGVPQFEKLVSKLANYGRLEIFGRPAVGGILRWWRH